MSYHRLLPLRLVPPDYVACWACKRLLTVEQYVSEPCLPARCSFCGKPRPSVHLCGPGPCARCGEHRTYGEIHICPTAFAEAEKARTS